MIGERLKKLRKEYKINQEDLGAIVGVQKSSISLYETNKIEPSDKIKVKLAKHFNISLDYLLGVIDEPVPYYDKVTFLMLDDSMNEGDRALISEFLSFVRHRGKIDQQ